MRGQSPTAFDPMAAGHVAARLLILWLLAWPAQVAADDSAKPAQRLHMDCVGSGSPVVVLDSGLGGSALEWAFVKEGLRSLTRVCSFDRAGYGGSSMGPLPRTSSRIVNELYLQLEDAGMTPPFVLAGHSFGGYNMQLFARRYPFLVAGLVLVDASHPDQVERLLAPPLGLLTAPSSRWGIVQFREPPPPSPLLPEPLRRLIADHSRRWKTRRAVASELLAFRDSALELRQARPHADLPLLVITRGKSEGRLDEKRLLLERVWLELQTELAESSATSAHLIAHGAGHNVHIEQPELVAFGIELLVERYRRGAWSQDVGSPFTTASRNRRILHDATWLKDDLDIDPGPLPAHLATWQSGAAVMRRPGAP